MNYKEAMQAWLDNPEIKLEYRRGEEDKWYQFFNDFPERTPVFYADTEYRIKTKPLMARVAKFTSYYSTISYYYRLIMESEFSDTEKRNDFVRWATNLLELE